MNPSISLNQALFPFKDWWVVPAKVAFDQTIWSAIWNSIYFVVLGFLRLESPTTVFSELKSTFFPMLTVSIHILHDAELKAPQYNEFCLPYSWCWCKITTMFLSHCSCVLVSKPIGIVISVKMWHVNFFSPSNLFPIYSDTFTCSFEWIMSWKACKLLFIYLNSS